MSDLTTNSFLEQVLKEIVTDVNKKVRDSILLGKAKLSRSHTVISTELSDDLTLNQHYLSFKLKEFRLSQTVERKKKLQMNLFKLDEKIGKLKSKLEAKSEIDVKNSMNRNLLINSPVTKSRVLKIPKMSDDSERRQKDYEAKKFVRKLNKEKQERLVEEKRRIQNKLILIDDASYNSSNNNPENQAKMYVILPKINKNPPGQFISPTNAINSNTLSIEQGISPSSKFKEAQIEDIRRSNDFTFKRNGENIIQNEYTLMRQAKPNLEQIAKIQKIEESLFDNSISFKSNKKSPYYFNDPKYSKLMEIKQKYIQKSNVNKNSKNDTYNGDIKYISDQNNISEEDYEILKNLHS